MCYDISMVVGRFQPLHKEHVALINKALEIGKKTVVVHGHSSFCDLRNPFTSEEVFDLLNKEFGNKIEIVQLFDNCSDSIWTNRVKNSIVKSTCSGGLKICLVGERKDLDMYLKLFPTFDYLINSKVHNVSATEIRKEFFINGTIIRELLPEVSIEFLKHYKENKKKYCELKKGYSRYYSIGVY